MADMQDATLFLICIASIIFFLTIWGKTQTQAQLPPSPRGLPIIGHLHMLGPVTHQALHKLSTRYGPLVYFFIGSKPCVLASSPEMAKEILKTNETKFLNRPKTANLDYLTYGSSDFATVHYGPYWKFMKKLCMNQLLGGRRLDQLRPIRQEETRRFLMLMLKKAEASERVNFGGELMRLTNNIITRMTLGQRCSDKEDEAGEVRKLVQALTQLGAKFNLSDTIWFCKKLDLQGFRRKLEDARKRYDVMMERIMKEHEESRKKRKQMGDEGDSERDLLDVLFHIFEDKNAEMRLTRANIKAFIMNIFGAGTDTSSITLEWGLAELINHPNVMEKARKEIDSVVGKNRIVEESDIANLPYLQAIVKEILRLHPTGPLVVRESSEDCIIAGYMIPAKTRLFVNLWSLGRDSSHWENPHEFRPERFLSEKWCRNNQFLDVRGQNFPMIPFGSGRRSCPGATLALHFVPTTIAAIIQCFELKVGYGENDIVDMEEGPGLTLRRAHSLVCTPVARLTPFPSI
ncbi:3,9-dihydroxypterocarpan 6A-monooxygenase-like [Pistacia vera]|uniref:3,9-dihydroxypterocarpan 6A-monooxygenase-like n=1 Tax=Pistacia vera TaxID=55513 RepID=UPI001262BBE8|nr:3,9-dihydroxypterocarpan 6A-monooxygenase-like [Pistacia vera]XP_031259472.1 3,9-dihydroxypterocarpan 6A-monooxygenase-like [Pistacia vera]XP_031266400.1 3,9-dihydroxypterocarpan 6A-monooxygenase-like [Pistacia vera]